MKVRETKKSIRSRFTQIVGMPYGRAQNLLRFQKPFAYSDRVEGWACDYYVVGGVLISTGYDFIDSIGVNNVDARPYDERARAILHNYDIPYEEQKKQVEEILYEYIDAVRK